MVASIFITRLFLAHLRYVALLAALVSVSTQAQTWFDSCDRVAERSKFFKEYWEDNDRPKGPCFLLNSRELIYSDEYGVIYQSLKTKKAESIVLTGRNPGVPKEFVGINKKRYAFISDFNMNDGWESNGLVLMYLIPPRYSGPRAGLPFEVVYLVSSQDGPDTCEEKKAVPSCKSVSTVRFGDGVSEWVDFSYQADFLTFEGPRLIRRGELVSAIEFDLYFANEKKKFKTVRYALKAGSPHFHSDDLADVAKAVLARYPVQVTWIREQNSESKD